jgi:pyruvate formate-lyase/glycerol dehydratase family glycyl radical enzyme
MKTGAHIEAQAGGRLQPHPRNARVRADILSGPMRIGVERATLWSRGEELAGDAPPPIKNALAFEYLVNNMELVIRADERIAGNKTRHLLGLPWFIERGDINRILAVELGALGKRNTNRVILDEYDRAEIRRLLKKYQGRTAFSQVYDSLQLKGVLKKPAFPVKELRRMSRGLGLQGFADIARRWIYPALRSPGIAAMLFKNVEYVAVILNAAYGLLAFQGHLIFGHDHIIAKGYDGIAAESEEMMAAIHAEDPERDEKLHFYEAVKICCSAAKAYTLRLADHAEEMAAKDIAVSRKEDLVDMAASLRQVAGGKPTNFREAVQSLWLSKLLLELYHPMSTISLGRVDRMLAPFYQKDLVDGKITPWEARGYLEELYLKIWTCTLWLGPGVQESSSYNFAGYQALTIGGIDEEGRDVTSDLTFLCIDALDAIRPVINLCVRLHPASPPELLDRVVEAIAGGVSLAVYNDDVYIRSLQRLGVSEEHARDYAIIGCVEQVSASRTGGSTGSSQLNLAGLVDMALRNGSVGMPLGRFISGGEGHVEEDFHLPEDFDALMAAFEKQLDHAVDEIVRGVNIIDRAYMDWPTPFISMTIDGCLESGRDVTAGGGIYDANAVTLTGMANAVDSMMVVKKAVYDEGWASMEELLEAIDCNFRGYEGLRQKIINRVPKFGNDEDEVDLIARRVMDMTFRKILSHTNIRGGRFSPAYISLALHIIFGQALGATADGRLAGTPICNSLSPVNGMDRNGPTAVLNSIAKIDTSYLSTGAAVNMKFNPLSLSSEESRQKLAHLIQAYFSQGGPQLQITLADVETLRKAKKHPDEYPNLVVKVGGFSALFADLGRDIQDDIISRMEHNL